MSLTECQDEGYPLQSWSEKPVPSFSCPLAGSAVTIADVALAAALQPLLASVLSAEARLPYPDLLLWFTALSQSQQFAKVLGESMSQSQEQQEFY